MNKCDYSRKKFLDGNYDVTEEIEIWKHLKQCNLCIKQLEKEGVAKDDMIFLWCDADIEGERKEIYKKAKASKEQRHANLINKIKSEEISSVVRKDYFPGEKNKSILNDITNYFTRNSFLKPAIVSILLLIGGTYIFYPQNDKTIYTGVKSNTGIQLSFSSAKKGANETFVNITDGIKGGVYTQDDNFFLRYSAHDKGYLYIIHINQEGSNLIYPDNPEQVILTNPGTYDLARKNELFNFYFNDEIKGKHHFVAAFSKNKINWGLLKNDLQEVTAIDNIKSIFKNKIEEKIGFDYFSVQIK